MPTTKAFKRATAQTLQQHLPIWVISLARATERRETMVKTLAAAGITNYELVDAVDSRNTTAVSKAMLNRCGCMCVYACIASRLSRGTLQASSMHSVSSL